MIDEKYFHRIERFFGLKGEARIRYLDGEYQVLGAGDFVRCAVTGDIIALAELRYWSVDRQEAYATPAAALERHKAVVGKQA